MREGHSRGFIEPTGEAPQPSGFGKPEQEYRDPRFAELDRLIASGAARNGLTASIKFHPKRKRRFPLLPREYRQDITRMAHEHRRKYRPLFMADPKLKDRAARFYRSLLLPKPKRRGRPPIDSVTKADGLLKKFRGECSNERPEQHWARVYPLVIPGYGEMSDVERRHAREQLRERVRWTRRTRRRIEKPPIERSGW